MTTQIELIAYIAVFIFTFSAGSFLVARFTHESPTSPTNFGLLVGASLIWPITLPLSVVIFMLLCIAWLADNLAVR